MQCVQVTDGNGVALVTAVGGNSEWGIIMDKVVGATKDDTPLQEKLGVLSTITFCALNHHIHIAINASGLERRMIPIAVNASGLSWSLRTQGVCLVTPIGCVLGYKDRGDASNSG